MACLQERFIYFSPLWRLEVWDQAEGSGEAGSFPGCRLLTPLRVLTGHNEGKRALWGSFYKGIRALPSCPNYLPKAPPPNALRVCIEHTHFEATQTFNPPHVIILNLHLQNIFYYMDTTFFFPHKDIINKWMENKHADLVLVMVCRRSLCCLQGLLSHQNLLLVTRVGTTAK